MPKTAKGRKVMSALRKEYGSDAEHVYYGMVNSGKLKGAEPRKAKRRAAGRVSR